MLARMNETRKFGGSTRVVVTPRLIALVLLLTVAGCATRPLSPPPAELPRSARPSPRRPPLSPPRVRVRAGRLATC